MGEESKGRMQMILERIPTTGGYITSAEIARQLGLSEKTVRTTIKELNGMLHGAGALICPKTRAGYTLKVQDTGRFQAFLGALAKEEEGKLPDTAEERMQYLLWLLLNRTEYIKMDELCDFLYVTRPTLSNDLYKVEQILHSYNISVVRRPNYGIMVQGKEFDVRNCMIHRTICDLEKGKPKYIGRYQEDFEKINEILQEKIQKYGLRLSQMVFQDLTVSIFITLRRMKRARFVPLTREEILQDISEETVEAAGSIMGAVGDIFQVDVPESEVNYIAVNLAGKCNYDTFAGECCQMIPAFVEKLAEQMLETVYETFRLDVRRHLTLLMFLVQHLFPVTIRLKYHITVKNDFIEEVKRKYAFAYAVASQAVIPLKLKYNEEISEDEIAYFAVLFALALEQEKEKTKKQNILIICAAGMSSARLLAYQYKQEFKNYVDEVYCCDIYNIDQMDFSKIDYIFSTVPLKKRLPKPVMEVKFFLNQEEIANVKNVLRFGMPDILTEYYSEDMFFAGIKGETKEEVIRELCRFAGKKYALPEGFYQAVIKREELAATDFGNRVALPHPYKAIAEDTFVCVGILEHPITWVKNEVQVVFLVSIAPTEERELQTFYQMTASLMQDAEAIDELIEKQDFFTLLKLLCKKRD